MIMKTFGTETERGGTMSNKHFEVEGYTLPSENIMYTKMYHQMMESELFDGEEKITFLALKKFTNFTHDKGGIKEEVWPSLDTLVKYLGWSRQKISRIIKRLEAKGVIKVIRQGLNKPNKYIVVDFPRIWDCKTPEELAEVVKTPMETTYTEELNKKGYEVMSKEEAARLRELEQRVKELEQAATEATEEPQTKEKPATGANPETSNTAQPTNISFSNNDYKRNYTPSQDEIYSMDMIKSKYEYEYMLMDRPYEKGIIDSVFDYIYDTLNEPSEFVRVQRTRKPKKVVISRFMKLNRESILFVIDRYQAQINRIQYPKQYIITQLYEAPAQFEMDITNRVNHDLYGA